MEEPADYNQRQYHRMMDRLEGYENGRLHIVTLINELEGLLYALEGIPTSWKEEFITEWADLEVARAIMLEKGLTNLGEAEKKITLEAVARLKKLVTDKLDKSEV